MKRTVTFLLALMLLCPVALADTLREQVNAPMEHKGTYSSPSGRSHIYVDAQVIVPEAETIPIYQAFARVPDETAGGPCVWSGRVYAGKRQNGRKQPPRALHMRKVIQPKLLKACTSIASALICDLLPCFISRRTFPMCKPNTQYRIMQRTHMLSPAWSISPTEAISEKTCRRRQTQGPRQTRLYLRYFRIFSSGGQRIKRI